MTKQYLELGKDILANGNYRSDRTNVGTISVFGRQIRFDLSKGFPLLTTKKMFLKGIIHELLWFLQGDTNNNTLNNVGVTIWNEWCIENKRELSLRERYQWFLEHKASAREFDDVSLNDSIETAHVSLDKEDVPRYESLEGDGDLGPIYGKQWRSWKDIQLVDPREAYSLCQKNYEYVGCTGTEDPVQQAVIIKNHDQISELIHNLKTKPFSRRHIVSAWNVADLPDESISPQENVKNGKMALAPCHCLFQFYVRERSGDELISAIWEHDTCSNTTMIKYDELTKDLRSDSFVEGWTPASEFIESAAGYRHPDYMKVVIQFAKDHGIPIYRLDCQLYQRSADFPLGVPYNIASYALLTMMIAQCVNMVPGEFIHTFGDVHIYNNQIEKFKEQLERDPYELPIMQLNPEVKDIFSFKYEDFQLLNYQSHPKIDYPISV